MRSLRGIPSTTAAIDVICPAWNRSEAIRPTIDSVLAQTFGDWRLLVVSDGCTDDTDDVVRSYDNERVQLIRAQRHGHPGGPRSIGPAASTAPAIAYLDNHDLWMPDHLAVLRREFEGGARLVATGNIGMNAQGEEEYRSHPSTGSGTPSSNCSGRSTSLPASVMCASTRCTTTSPRSRPGH
ncbi:glycosyltransferase family 2 protein [Streptomyces sp. NPDC005774]|uniref:glycosyltransferase family 2 protein n=1 Tax=Streptomyces sp. NPDC005774 TaxID=3364728 RepID=UPI0036AA8DE6